MPHIVKETVELTVATTGYSVGGVLSEKFGREGKILQVVSRLDPTLDKATAGVIIITDGEADAIDADTPDEAKVYESSSITMAGGSATVAELIDTQDPPAPYALAIDEQLKIAANITAAAGGGASTKLYVTVIAEVYR